MEGGFVVKRPRIFVVEFRFSGDTEWDICDPILAHPLQAAAEREAEQRCKKYPNTQYRVAVYAFVRGDR